MSMKRYVVAFYVITGLWIMSLITVGACRNAAFMGPVGDSLAPVGSMLTALALLFAFKQRHADQETAHRDKLAAAYVTWFQDAWRISGEMIVHAEDAAERMSGARPTRYDPGEAVKQYDNVRGRDAALRIAAAPLLMIERDKTLLGRVKKTYGTLPVWDKPFSSENVGAFREFTATLPAELRQLRDQIEELYWDAVGKIEASTD